jgi:hypothetical protein
MTCAANGRFPEGMSSAKICEKTFTKLDLQTAFDPLGVTVFRCAHV